MEWGTAGPTRDKNIDLNDYIPYKVHEHRHSSSRDKKSPSSAVLNIKT